MEQNSTEVNEVYSPDGRKMIMVDLKDMSKEDAAKYLAEVILNMKNTPLRENLDK